MLANDLAPPLPGLEELPSQGTHAAAWPIGDGEQRGVDDLLTGQSQSVVQFPVLGAQQVGVVAAC